MKGANEMTQFIRERLEDGKHRQYGQEPVSELVHALQCATLAEDEGQTTSSSSPCSCTTSVASLSRMETSAIR